MSRPGISLTPGGRDFVRCAIAHALADHPSAAAAVARARWGEAFVQRAAVAGAEDTDLTADRSTRSEFFARVVERSIFGRMPGLRRVSRNVRHFKPSAAALASWVGESKGIPVSRATLEGFALRDKKAGTIAVYSNQSLRDPQAENWIEADMTRACLAALDGAALDFSNAGSDSTPASITAGAPTITSSGDPHEDVASLIANFSGDLSTSAFITDPVTAGRLCLHRDSSGVSAFPDAGVNGGSICGLPLITTRHAPHDSSGGSLILADGAGIAASLEDVALTPTREALLELDDSPQGASDTPVAASATLIACWQIEATAIKALVYGDWLVVRPGAVAIVTGANY
jgi:hypothetical protein